MELDDLLDFDDAETDPNKILEMKISKRDANFLALKQKIIATSSIITSYSSRKLECEEKDKEISKLKKECEVLRRDYHKLLLSNMTIEKEFEEMKIINTELIKQNSLLDTKEKAGNAHLVQLQELHKNLQNKNDGTEIEIELFKTKDAQENTLLRQMRRQQAFLYKYVLLFGRKATLSEKINVKERRVYLRFMKRSEGLEIDKNTDLQDILDFEDFSDLKTNLDGIDELDDAGIIGPLSCASTDTGLGSSVCTSDDEKYPSTATTPTRDGRCGSPTPRFQLSFPKYSPKYLKKLPKVAPLNVASLVKHKKSVDQATSPINIRKTSPLKMKKKINIHMIHKKVTQHSINLSPDKNKEPLVQSDSTPDTTPEVSNCSINDMDNVYSVDEISSPTRKKTTTDSSNIQLGSENLNLKNYGLHSDPLVSLSNRDSQPTCLMKPNISIDFPDEITNRRILESKEAVKAHADAALHERPKEIEDEVPNVRIEDILSEMTKLCPAISPLPWDSIIKEVETVSDNNREVESARYISKKKKSGDDIVKKIESASVINKEIKSANNINREVESASVINKEIKSASDINNEILATCDINKKIEKTKDENVQRALRIVRNRIIKSRKSKTHAMSLKKIATYVTKLTRMVTMKEISKILNTSHKNISHKNTSHKHNAKVNSSPKGPVVIVHGPDGNISQQVSFPRSSGVVIINNMNGSQSVTPLLENSNIKNDHTQNQPKSTLLPETHLLKNSNDEHRTDLLADERNLPAEAASPEQTIISTAKKRTSKKIPVSQEVRRNPARTSIPSIYRTKYTPEVINTNKEISKEINSLFGSSSEDAYSDAEITSTKRKHRSSSAEGPSKKRIRTSNVSNHKPTPKNITTESNTNNIPSRNSSRHKFTHNQFVIEKTKHPIEVKLPTVHIDENVVDAFKKSVVASSEIKPTERKIIRNGHTSPIGKNPFDLFELKNTGPFEKAKLIMAEIDRRKCKPKRDFIKRKISTNAHTNIPTNKESINFDISHLIPDKVPATVKQNTICVDLDSMNTKVKNDKGGKSIDIIKPQFGEQKISKSHDSAIVQEKSQQDSTSFLAVTSESAAVTSFRNLLYENKKQDSTNFMATTSENPAETSFGNLLYENKKQESTNFMAATSENPAESSIGNLLYENKKQNSTNFMAVASESPAETSFGNFLCENTKEESTNFMAATSENPAESSFGNLLYENKKQDSTNFMAVASESPVETSFGNFLCENTKQNSTNFMAATSESPAETSFGNFLCENTKQDSTNFMAATSESPAETSFGNFLCENTKQDSTNFMAATSESPAETSFGNFLCENSKQDSTNFMAVTSESPAETSFENFLCENKKQESTNFMAAASESPADTSFGNFLCENKKQDSTNYMAVISDSPAETSEGTPTLCPVTTDSKKATFSLPDNVVKSSQPIFIYKDKDAVENIKENSNLSSNDRRTKRNLMSYDDNNMFSNKKNIFKSIIDEYMLTKPAPIKFPSPHSDKTIKNITTLLNDCLTSDLSSEKLDMMLAVFQVEKQKRVARTMIEFLCAEHATKPSLLDDPSMPVKSLHQRIVLCCLNRMHREPQSTQNKYNIIELVMGGIEFKLFTLKNSVPLEALVNLASFYTILCKMTKQKERLKAFCMDAMYNYSYKATPLIYKVLLIWPHLFPSSHHFAAQDPLIGVIVHFLLSHFSTDPLYCSQVMQSYLLQRYGFRTGATTDSALLKRLLGLIRDNNSKLPIKNLQSAFLLLGKHSGVDWTFKNIIADGLIPLMEDVSAPDHKRALAAHLIGAMSRPFPIGMKLQYEALMNKFINALIFPESPMLEEGLVRGLVFMSNKNFSFAVSGLLRWNNTKETVSDETMELLNLMLPRKSRSFWQYMLHKNEDFLKYQS